MPTTIFKIQPSIPQPAKRRRTRPKNRSINWRISQMLKKIFQIRLTLILLTLFAAIPALSQTVPTTPSENTAEIIQQIPCAEIADAKERTNCELSLMLNKTLSDKRAAID